MTSRLTILGALILSTVFLSPVEPSIINPERVTLLEPVTQPAGPARLRGSHITVDYTASAVQFSILCGDVFRFQWVGTANREYQVETSTDLKAWSATGVIFEGRNTVETWYEIATNKQYFRLTIVNL